MTGLEAIDRELARLHEEMSDVDEDSNGFDYLLAAIRTLNEALSLIAKTELNTNGLSKPEIKLASAWMIKAGDEFSNHGCNDIPSDILALLTKEEWDNLEKQFQKFNGTPEEYEPGRITQCDAAWMSYLAKRLKSLL
jgi:hypothetical protein